ncbi:MAG: NAD(P)-dependent oxidoreductase [Nitrospirales bacterium]|nr:MAG: NAD(P)-dependent oxidoreductase [Nitrospirales bacterium]
MSKTELQSRPLVILGAGYTGTFLYPLAKTHGWRTYATSRNPITHLPLVPENDRIIFDLTAPKTWGNIPKNAHVIWCFPALPQDAAVNFIEQHFEDRGRLIMLGSTSAYGSGQPSPVDEHAPLDYSIPRVQSEEYLRETYGAVVLRLAGLYGPGRHVLDWMRKGKVNNTNKYVNLIHIEDVAAICLAALERAKAGEVYNVSDGISRQWSKIFEVASERWGLRLPPLSPPQNPGKRLTIAKLRSTLHSSFLHPDLYEALEEIEKQNNR